jgi:hypothetical protein
MAYTINYTNGAIFATIADGTINTSSSMILVGKNYAGYGEFLDENFLHLLENGANNVAPGAPIPGQLWFDTSVGIMKVYNGSTFKTLGAATASASAPTSNVTGDLWFDTTNQQLKCWNGTSFILIGPAGDPATAEVVIESINDNTSVSHVIIRFVIQSVTIAIMSKDPTFTPQVAITGFATIVPGLNLSTTAASGGALFYGTASDSQLLDGLNSTSFMRSDAAATNNTSISITADAGLTVGASNNGRLLASGSDIVVRNQTSNGDLNLSVNIGGSQTTAVNVDGATGFTGVRGITNLNANAVGNIGSASTYFNTVFATATTALYADVAERFHADETYLPGTVVELGGPNEITISRSELSENVFGVISTRAAYLMNAGAGTDATHPPVAMTGRVPVRVKGSVRKGDRLVSAGSGLARAAQREEITAYNVIGRSLQDKPTEEEGTIEAIVTIN